MKISSPNDMLRAAKKQATPHELHVHMRECQERMIRRLQRAITQSVMDEANEVFAQVEKLKREGKL